MTAGDMKQIPAVFIGGPLSGDSQIKDFFGDGTLPDSVSLPTDEIVGGIAQYVYMHSQDVAGRHEFFFDE